MQQRNWDNAQLNHISPALQNAQPAIPGAFIGDFVMRLQEKFMQKRDRDDGDGSQDGCSSVGSEHKRHRE